MNSAPSTQKSENPAPSPSQPASSPPVAAASPAKTAPSRRFWTQPGFVIAVVILTFSAIGMNAAIGYLDLAVKKLPAPLVQPLTSVPAKVGHWKQVSIDEPLDQDMESELATKEYIFRDYVDTDKVDKPTMDSFEGKSSMERHKLAARIQGSMPDAVINMAVTYYTGKADTVAHIPERCYVADGFHPTVEETHEWDMGPGRLGQPANHPAVPVHYLNFEDTTDSRRPTCRVAYFFFANGNYECDSLRVRETLQNLKHKHVFYSKIELKMLDKDDRQTQQVMCDFLRAVMPSVESCYPDWKTVEGISAKK